MSIAKIRCPGGLANALVVERVRSSCGDVADGIGVRWEGTPRGIYAHAAWSGYFILSWEDFEAAYLTLKAMRAPLDADSEALSRRLDQEPR